MKKSWFEKETEKIYAKELDQHMRTTGQDLSMLSKEDQMLVVRHRLGKARERRFLVYLIGFLAMLFLGFCTIPN